MKPSDESLRTNWSLLGRLKNWRDEESWRTFYDLYRDVILGVARKAGLREDEAEVVLQETMTSVCRKIGDFEANPARGPFRTWLFRLAKWRIEDQRRRRLPIASQSENLGDDTMRTPTVERVPDPHVLDLDALFENGWREKVLARAHKLLEVEVSAPHYQAFHLLTVQKKSVPEVAQLLGKSRAELYLIKHRVAKVLKRIVQRIERTEARGVGQQNKLS